MTHPDIARTHHREAQRRYRERHPEVREEARAYNREYYRLYAHQQRAYARDYYRAHRAEILARKRAEREMRAVMAALSERMARLEAAL